MGKTFNSTKVLGKLATFTMGCIPATVRGVDMGLEKVAPDFREKLVDSGWGSLALGDSVAHDHAMDAGFDFFTQNNKVTLTDAEMKDVEVAAKAMADQSGISYEIVLDGMIDIAIAAKKSQEPVK